MQIIDVTDGEGVRTAVLTLSHPTTQLRFVLFPMCHVGERRYFTDVAERSRGCDLLVVEGIVGRARRGGMLTTPPKRTRSYGGLVEADVDYGALGVPTIRPDVTGQDFDVAWQRAPRSHRALWRILYRGYHVALGTVLSRRRLAWVIKHVAPLVNEGEPASPVAERLENLVGGGRRDPKLQAALADIHRDRAHEALRVAVIYGAAHMPAVIELLQTLGYQATDSEWLTVFRY